MAYEDIKIKKVEFLYQNQVNRRKVKVTLSNKTIIYIEACYESFEQYGGTYEELKKTVGIAYKYNDWLHGEELYPEPYEEDENNEE